MEASAILNYLNVFHFTKKSYIIWVFKDASDAKQSAKYEIPWEMNTVENFTQHLPLGSH